MTILIIALIVVAIVAGAGTAFYYNQPENVVLNSVVALAEDITEREEYSIIFDALENGMVEVDVTSMVDEANASTDISGKLYFSDETFALEDFSFTVEDGGGRKALDLSGDLYISDGLVYVNTGDQLGGAYGLELDRLTEDFRNSIFAYGSGSKYEIADKETFDEIIEVLEKYKETKDNNAKMRRDAERILDKYLKKVWSIIFDNVEVTDSKVGTLLDGTKGSFRKIKIKLDERMVLAIIEDVYEFLKSDGSVTKFLEKYEDELAAYKLLPEDGEGEDKTLAEKYVDALEEWDTDRGELYEQFKGGKVFQDMVIELITPEYKAQILQLGYTIRGYSSFVPISYTVCYGDEGYLATDRITTHSSALEGTMNFEIHENNDNRYWATCVYKHDPHVGKTYEDVEIFNLVLNRKNGEYDLLYGTDTNYFRLAGKYSRSEDSVDLSIAEIGVTAYDGRQLYERKIPTTCRFVFRRDVDAPDKPTDYKTISDITEADVDGLIELFGVQEEYLPE